MTRRGLGLAVGAAFTLLLAAWVSAAGKVGVFARPNLTGPESKAPGEQYGPGAIPTVTNLGGKGRADAVQNDALAGAIAWGMKLLLVAIVLVVLGAVAKALWEQWRERDSLSGDEAAADLVPESLLAATTESEELLARGTPANAVVAAWLALEDAVRDAGVRDDRARTSAELVRTVLRSYAVDADALDRLAALYREARFSRHPLGEERRNEARTALQQVRADLLRSARAAAGTGGSANSRPVPRGGHR